MLETVVMESKCTHSGDALVTSIHPELQPHPQGTPLVEDFGYDRLAFG